MSEKEILRARIRELEEEVQYLEAECRALRHTVFQLRRDLHER